jgi:integrase/recombinase XerD
LLSLTQLQSGNDKYLACCPATSTVEVPQGEELTDPAGPVRTDLFGQHRGVLDPEASMPTLTATPISPAPSRPDSGCTHNGDYGVVLELPRARCDDTSRADQLAGDFLTSYRAHTAAAYRRDLADFFGHCAAHHLHPPAARRVDLARYLQALEAAGLSPATIARRLVAVRGYYSYCVDEDALPTSPAARLKVRRQRSQTLIRALSAADLARLLDASDAHSPRLSALTWVLATTGLRISEACDARIEDLHGPDDQPWLDVTCKGNVRRSVPLTGPARQRVATLIAGRDAGPVFATRTGTPLDRHSAARTLRRIAADLDLGPFSPHVLRHTFVTLSRANGCALEDVQDAVGHADPATTRRYDRTVASMATHPAGRLLAALEATTTRRLPVPIPTAAARQTRTTGRPLLRLICS